MISFLAMFHSPWYLLLLVFLPPAGLLLFASRRRPAIRFSSVGIARQLQPTVRQKLMWLPPALTLAAMLFLILGLARPRQGREQTVIDSEGIAIELAVDRSGSMQALDFQIDGERVDRLAAIKNVAGKFVGGGEGLDGRVSDLVGLVTFAGYADAVTPSTLDHGFLVSQLNNVKIATSRNEDGTAIGDALSLAVEKLNGLDARQKEKVKSKIVILLTDGENNAGELDPKQAAELAATLGIKVYTIGVGTRGEAPVPVADPFTGRQLIRMMPVSIDEATLQKVAELTGGKYFRATDTDSLRKIYAEIDKLEKTKVEAKNFVDYRELAVQPWRTGRLWGWLTVPPLLLLAFVLLAARWFLQQTWLRELA